MANWIARATPIQDIVKPALDLQTLEDRVLYSAGPLPVDSSVQFEPVVERCEAIECYDSVDAQLGFAINALEFMTLEGQESELLDQNTIAAAPVASSLELVIVDDSVEGHEQLVEDLLSQRSDHRNFEILYLSQTLDGLSQITSWLSLKSNVNAIHIVSHGGDGELRLGSTNLNGDNLEQFQTKIALWKDSLADGADLLIYGCSVAESAVGENFVLDLAKLLDVDISASSDTTGGESSGGDWSLEFSVGIVESDVAFSKTVLADWNHTLPIANPVPDTEFDLAGRVVEDVDGNGDLAENIGLVGVAVYLYQDDGDGVMGAGDVLVERTVTDAVGDFLFLDLQDGTSYFTVVDSKTIASGTLNAGYDFGDVWAEQTYGSAGSANEIGGLLNFTSTDGALFSGKTADVSDDASSLTTAEHVTRIAIDGANVSGVDFGFSFNVVTNSLGGDGRDDDSGVNQRSVQGSLRQFITNANALDGNNEMRFVPMSDADSNNGSNSHWEIIVSIALPDIEDAGTTIDGRAYLSDGVTLFNANAAILGFVGTVGVGIDGVAGTGDEALLDGLDAPELEITGTSGISNGLNILGSDTEIRNIAIHGFGHSGRSSGNIFVNGASNVYIHDNVIGARADSFSLPDTALLQTVNIFVRRADNGIIEGNLIGFAREAGIKFERNANQWTISQNEIRSNGIVNTAQAGIDFVGGSRNSTVSANLIVGNAGYGIDSLNGGGGYQIIDNTIIENGIGGVETGGVRLMGDGSSVEHNVIGSNIGPGVHVIGEYNDGRRPFSPSTGNLISQNSFALNTGISIDLSSSHSSRTILDQGDGISLNAIASDVDAGNDGLDYPTLTSAFVTADGLHVIGQIDPSLNVSRFELYVADSGTGDLFAGTAFGEGQTYLGTVFAADRVSFDPITGQFEAVLSTPSGGWPDELTNGGTVTAIAIQDLLNNTSEFGNATDVNFAPVSVDSTVVATESQLFQFERSDFGFTDINDSVYDSITIETPPTGGNLFLSGVQLVGGETVLASDIDLGRLTYQPDTFQNGVGYDEFEFRINDSQLPSSNSAKMTIDVTPVNDPPVFQSNPNWVINENQKAVGNIVASDVDGDVMTYSIVGGLDQFLFTIDPTTGQLEFVAAPNFEAPTDSNGNNQYHVDIQADDGNGRSTQQTVNVRVRNIAEAPVAMNDAYSVNEGQSFVQDVTTNDFDQDGGPLTVTIIDGPDHGSAFLNNDGELVYRHDGSETTSDFVTYEITDDSGLTDTATVSITVIPVDDPTFAVTDSLITSFEEVLVVDQDVLLRNDIDPDSSMSEMDVIITSQPANGVVGLVDGVLTFTPDADFSGLTSFEYQVDVNGVVGNTTVVVVIVGPSTSTPDPDPEEDSGSSEETTEEGQQDLLTRPITTDGDGETVDSTSDSSQLLKNNDNLVRKVANDDSSAENLIPTDFKVDLLGATYAYSSRVAQFSLANLASSLVVSSTNDISQFESSFAGLMWDDLDLAKRDFMMGQLQLGLPNIVASAASFLTVGYLAWIIRGGVLLSTFISSVPAWSSFDVLSVIESAGGKDQSIEQMVDS